VWRAPSPLPKGRTIAALVAHIHNCGLRYLERSAPGVPVPVHGHPITQQTMIGIWQWSARAKE
jgi:hypothetical protein